MNEEQTIEPGAAGAPEGAAAEPTPNDVAKMYDELGIKAPAPTAKPKGRPKASSVRAKNGEEDGAGDSASGSAKDDDDKGKSKDAPAASKNGDSGDNSDPKGAKNVKDSGKVQDESEEADAGVRKSEPGAEDDSKRGSEEDAANGAERTGQEDDESEDEAEKGKRPGKSNPEIEKRFQRLTEEKRAAEQRAIELEQKLQEREQAVAQSKISQEDPEYTIDDFRRVQDKDGNIIDLDPERAELAWRRWKDGYDQRAEERQAATNHEAARQEHEEEMTRQVMQDSVEAYDTLASLMDEYPELVSTSGKFDADFAAEAMPIIKDSIDYLEGTEPGNPDNNLPVVVGLKLHPKKILDALKNVNNKKRSLPLNGLNDTVESRSNVAVPHSRSSDSTVNQANQLYKELKINKRL